MDFSDKIFLLHRHVKIMLISANVQKSVLLIHPNSLLLLEKEMWLNLTPD